MADVDAQNGPADRKSRDRRIAYRIPVQVLGMTVVLYPAADQGAAVPGRLVNVSAGGCCLVAATWTAEGLAPGIPCAVTLPATKQGVSQPATLVSIEPGSTADEVLLRLRFRKADPVTQQQVTRWITELAVQAWHA